MDNEEFVKARVKWTDDRFNMCDAKSLTYTKGSKDRLNNFKELGRMLGQRPEQVLMTYYGKHDLALYAYVETGEEPSDGIFSTIADLQNYLDLLTALIMERRQDEDREGQRQYYPSDDSRVNDGDWRWVHNSGELGGSPPV
jgi:hypothetical protein